jgi:outer membrane receptor protein involved in Fe transport
MVDILNTLPQVFQNSAPLNTSNSLSTPGGLTTVNLRGLFSARWCWSTGVGHTADANTGNPNPAPNLDQIPVSLIERVDVVTGGAPRSTARRDAGVVNHNARTSKACRSTHNTIQPA